ncbi:MAG: hypothetical protein IKJ36_04550 [Clostridia bacterium]|nr:hypothetical protein [Clostridia bacterium]
MKNKSNILVNSLIIGVCAILLFAFIYLVLVTSNDELWNFQNIYKMINGYKIYNDSNVIITPIFFYLGAIFLEIFSAKFVVFRIYNIISVIILFVISYKIMKKLDLSKNLIAVYLSLLFLLMFQSIVAGANYNTLGCIFILLGIYLYITKKSTNFKQGLLIFLVFFTKQNTGIFYALSVIIYELFENKLSKKYILDQLKKFIFFLMPSSLVLLFMHFNGNLEGFINYCFGGLFEFGGSNLVFTAAPFYYALPLSSIGIYIFTILKKDTIFKTFKDNFWYTLKLLFIFAFVNTFTVYPIFNSSHFIYTFPYHLIFIFYYLDTLILKEIFDEDKYYIYGKIFALTILVLLLGRTLLYFFYDYDLISKYRSRNTPFDNLYSYTDTMIKTNDLKEYILEQEKQGITVLICSHDAAFPMIELKKSNGMYDLLFNGNLGYKGKDKVYSDIDNLKNTEFLVVTNEEDIFVQEPQEIRKYIMDNLELKGQIHNYSIYSTNK